MSKGLSHIGLILLMVFVLAGGSMSIFGQSDTNIFSKLEKEEGVGHIRVYQSAAIASLVGQINATSLKSINGVAHISSKGYRIQLYAGNNQQVAKNESTSRAKDFKEAYPDQKVYVTFSAPFWRVRVGNYLTHEQAHSALVQFKRTMPQQAKLMTIVKDEILLPY